MSRALATTHDRDLIDNDPSALAHLMAEACLDTKAKDVVTLDTSGQSDAFSRLVICSGTSDRQVQGIANNVIQSLQEHGHDPAITGLNNGQWVIIDCGDVVAHLFYESARSHYDLEGMWTRAKRV